MPGPTANARSIFQRQHSFGRSRDYPYDNPNLDWEDDEINRPSWLLSIHEKPTATKLKFDLPFISHASRRTLACSLHYLLERNSVKAFLWGDQLHEIFGGQSGLPHVSLT